MRENLAGKKQGKHCAVYANIYVSVNRVKSNPASFSDHESLGKSQNII